jgi:hypothetical protein
MQLILQGQIMGDVVVIHCQGHIVFGDEVRTLQREVEKLTHVRKNVVLQLAEVSTQTVAGWEPWFVSVICCGSTAVI